MIFQPRIRQPVAIVLLIALLPWMWPPEIFAQQGYVDLDQTVTAQDLDLLADYMVGVEALAGEALANADVNGDLAVDGLDLPAFVGLLVP